VPNPSGGPVNPIATAILPVIALTLAGWFVGRRGWLGPNAVKAMSNVAFVVLTPPLLFRTMSQVRVEQIDFRPLAAYFAAVGIVFFGTLAWRGLNRRAAVLALANTFSNTVMMGIPIVGVTYGQAGLVVLFTLISVHSLVILTTATVLLEVALLREERAAGQQTDRHLLHTVALAMRNAIVHPVPLPIIAGLLFAQTGAVLPPLLDDVLRICGSLFPPLALLLVGVALARTHVGTLWRPALALAAVKNLLLPALVALLGWAFGLRGLPFTVMVLAASLPIGANVFLFSQRYQVAQELVTAGVAVSAVLAIATVPVVMLLLAR
jgi:predicted permease